MQDDQGFIWFGTQYGLNRYDGYRFKVFANDSARRNTLSGVYIHSLFKDHAGFLWIGSDQFIDRFDPRTESFSHYQIDLGHSSSSSVAVMHIDQDRHGQIWLSTGLGLFRLDPASGKVKQFRHNPDDAYSLSSNDVQSTTEDRSGRLWVANRTGVDEFDWKTGKVKRHIPLVEPVRNCLVYEDREGLLWLTYDSGGGAGLATYDPRSNLLTRYQFNDPRMKLGFSGVSALFEDQGGSIWIASEGMGLVKLDRKRFTLIRYRNRPGEPQSIAENHLTALLEDRESNIWIGFHSKAPNLFSRRPPIFQQVFRDFGVSNGGDSLVNAIYEDRYRTLWVGTTNGLDRVDRDTGLLTFYRTTDQAGSAGIISIVEDTLGDLWLGSDGQGLKRLNCRTGRFTTYLHDPSNSASLSDNVVVGLSWDRSGMLWVATWDGLNRFDPLTGRSQLYELDPGMRTEHYHSLTQDSHGILWLGSDSGLRRFDPATSKFTVFTHSADASGSISNNRVNSVFFDHSDQMWVATQNGLDKFDQKRGVFASYTERNGLNGNAVSCMLEDGAGRLWMGTNRGISRFDPRSAVFTNYSSADGLGDADFTGWHACSKSGSGEMFFGGFSGSVAFDPAKVVDSAAAAPVVLTDFKVSGRSVAVEANSPLKQSITYTRSITLSHNQRNFSIEFASLNYLSAATTRYRYRLDGLDAGWNAVGSDQRIVSYSGLPPSTYLFHVEAANARGAWNEPGTALTVTILPAWWNTWAMKIFYFVLILLFSWLAYRYRLHKIAQAYHIRMEERVGERTRIAQELHDTLLQGVLSASMQLHVAIEGVPMESPVKPLLNRVLALMGQVIDEGRNAVRGLRSGVGHSLNLEQALARVREELGVKAEVEFRVIVEGRRRPMQPVVRDEVYSIGREALVNAFRHSRAKSVEVELEYAAHQLRMLVRDNGCGVDPLVLRSGREGHWGLSGMRERAEGIGARLNLWSSATAGTEVELSVPGHVAFLSQSSGRPEKRFARFLPRRRRSAGRTVTGEQQK